MTPSAPVRFHIGRVAGAAGPISAHTVRETPEEAFLGSDAELNEAEGPACEVDAASRLGAEAA